MTVRHVLIRQGDRLSIALALDIGFSTLELPGEVAGAIPMLGDSLWGALVPGLEGQLLTAHGEGEPLTWEDPAEIPDLTAGVKTTVYTDTASTGHVLRADTAVVEIFAMNCGGAGGSGRRGAAGSARCGGGGGGSGPWLYARVPVARLGGAGATVAHTLPTAPTGGAARSGTDQDGANGSGGGNLVVGPWTIPPALNGAGGTATTPAAGGGTRVGLYDESITITTPAGGNGQDVAGLNPGGTSQPRNASGGGGGAGLDTSNTARAGGLGGGKSAFTTSTAGITSNFLGGSGGTSGGGAGGAGQSPADEMEGGTGGGGGGSGTGNGGTGGAGGFPGGGGGGGGACVSGFSSGAGGNGGGCVVVYREYVGVVA